MQEPRGASQPLPTIASGARALLHWYADMGVNEAVAPEPADWFASQPAPLGPDPARGSAPTRPAGPTMAPPALMPTDEAVAAATRLAAQCDTLEALCTAIAAFEGCPLKAGARNTVICDGVPGADLLVIGEAPGREEDQIGRPFVGPAGQLLDRMLNAIGRDRRRDVLITNVIYWRPPGNRTPTHMEIEICRPFVMRLIELSSPKAILLAGGAPTQALTGAPGIMRARGRWRTLETRDGREFSMLPTLHPAYLLRQPAAKRLAWADLRMLAARLRED